MISHIITCLVTSASSIHQRPDWVLFIVPQDSLSLNRTAMVQGETSTESVVQSKNGICSVLIASLEKQMHNI